MSAPFDLTDNSVVVVIGTGAGGGVLANELAQNHFRGLASCKRLPQSSRLDCKGRWWFHRTLGRRVAANSGA